MNRLIPNLTILLLIVFSMQSYATDRCWLFFRDKGAISERISVLRSSWNQRSLDRRGKMGVGLDSLDLPVSEEYIERIGRMGARISEVSRWLNAISVEADSAVLTDLMLLDFVVGMTPVARLHRNELGWEESVEQSPAPIVADEWDEDHSLIPLGAYGRSWRQADQSGVIEAHRRGLTGAGVLIGMLDTGFQLNHRAFCGLELVAQHDFIFDDGDPSFDPTTDRTGQPNHGTACLSVIVGYDPGHLVGIAPKAAVALGKTELTGTEIPMEEDYWVAGIEWLEWVGADVVNSSLGYTNWYSDYDMDGVTSPASRAAQRACELGVIICNSAGNSGPDPITIGAPADARGVLTVAAVDSMGEIVGFSSRGPSADGRIKPDVAAMGRKVSCVWPSTWELYTQWNGTSLASPIVTGVVALVIEAHPDWTPWMVVEAIKSTADRSFRPDYSYGYGIVNAAAAIDYPSLSGRVVRLSDGEAVTDVTLQMVGNGNSLNTVSDHYGRYRFVNLPDGTYQLTAEVNDGSPIIVHREIIVPPSLPFDIILDDSWSQSR
ncbi:MAG: S8 family serine peptidase [Candidatus Electryoneaceae bacterium]|nr:S8 family serine peptidase [Candidatus Electryoneaceae bacterium]